MDIRGLKTFFTISTSAFNFVKQFSEAIGVAYVQTEMHELHIAALEELNKEEPSKEVMIELLDKMQELTVSQIAKNQEKLLKGGFM